jgi:hypothetical protein
MPHTLVSRLINRVDVVDPRLAKIETHENGKDEIRAVPDIGLRARPG